MVNKNSTYYYQKLDPWAKTYMYIRKRCLNPKDTKYARYGGRGIKALITVDELKKLWFRDKAYAMESPTIHRIDNDGNYELGNCMYIERDENARLVPKKSHCKNGHPLVGDNIKKRIGRNGKGSYNMNECRTCAKKMQKEWKLRKKAQQALNQDSLGDGK